MPISTESAPVKMDAAGKWQIRVNAGMGSAVRAEVTVDPPKTGNKKINGIARFHKIKTVMAYFLRM